MNTDMFDNAKIKYIRNLPQGNDILLIWIMVLVKAGRCNANGFIFLTENVPYECQTFANEFGLQPSIVDLAFKTFEYLKMIEVDGQGFICVIGWEEHQNAAKLEEIREHNRLAKKKSREKQRLLSSKNVNDKSGQVFDSHDTDIDKDIEIEKEEDKEIYIPFREIIDHLNQVCGTNYKHTAESHKKHIRARWNEKYTLDDFKMVIDKKATEWLNTEQAKFLRPETLFGNKFDGYLNQLASNKPNNKPQSQLDMIKNLLGEDDGAETNIKDTSTIDTSFF
ncbi:MAG: hypothetical protein K0Q53_151 [Massilibacillus sp.]|jgi:uncharacterized phage protein (TIGR02220 family)/predicted phage replisome organizer|nr:hypothetical protein [Massilibacillus sp.]